MAAVQVQVVNHKKYFAYRTFKMKDESALSEQYVFKIYSNRSPAAMKPLHSRMNEKQNVQTSPYYQSVSLTYLFLTIMGLGTQL